MEGKPQSLEVGPEIGEVVYRPQVKEYLEKRGKLSLFDFENVDWDDTIWTMKISPDMH